MRTHSTCVLRKGKTGSVWGQELQESGPGSVHSYTKDKDSRLSLSGPFLLDSQVQARKDGLNKQESAWPQEDWKCQGM